MFVTVAICTWNRSRLLDQTLARMAGVRVTPGVQWEVVVVNNNCTDETDAVVARHVARNQLPIRLLSESRPGQAAARNRAIDAARGEYVIWTDDDVLVDPGWLTSYVEAFRGWPEATFFGGPIRPWFESTPPAWLPDMLGYAKHLWAVLDLGPRTRPFGGGECPFGANMAIRAEVQRRFRFDPRTGHVAGGMAGGDETTLFAQLLAEGHTGVWVADAVVDHFIPADRMTLGYVRTRAEQYGYQNHDPVADAGAKRALGLPGYVISQYLRSSLIRRLYPFVPRKQWARAVYQSARWSGVIRRVREFRRSQPSPTGPV